MTWNFRVVKRIDPKSGRAWYAVHEVFYTEIGKPWTMTQEPVTIEGESLKEVRGYLRMIERDIRLSPVLDLRKVRWAKMKMGKALRGKTIKDLRKGLCPLL